MKKPIIIQSLVLFAVCVCSLAQVAGNSSAKASNFKHDGVNALQEPAIAEQLASTAQPFTFHLQIIEPDKDLDYSLVMVVPDENMDYRTPVIDPESLYPVSRFSGEFFSGKSDEEFLHWLRSNKK